MGWIQVCNFKSELIHVCRCPIQNTSGELNHSDQNELILIYNLLAAFIIFNVNKYPGKGVCRHNCIFRL